MTVALTALFVLILAQPVAAQQKEWPPISPEEAALADCPYQPGAAAVYLFREEIRDEEVPEFKIFKRLKILTAAGRDRANIEIPYSKGVFKVVDLEARVIPPEGHPRVFGGQIFDKTAFRGPGIRVAVKSFALPDVTPGSIIEYRYRLVSDTGRPKGKVEDLYDLLPASPGKPPEGGIGKGMRILSFPAGDWDIQEDLFTRKARFVYVPGSLWKIILPYLFEGRGTSLLWFAMRIPGASPVWKKGQLELEVENIPPFEPEELMPPEKSEKMVVHIFHFDSKVKDPKSYWETECRNWQKASESFLGPPDKLADISRRIIGREIDPTLILKKLYVRAQEIRNLSYEKGLTSRQRKEQKIRDNRNAADVLARNYGYRSDITRAFVALARAAGFEAEVVRVSNRDDKLFHGSFLSFTGQLDSELAMVTLDGKAMLFDPATPFCPFGLVHWSRSNTTAVRFSDNPPAFFTTPAYPPELALTQREIAMRLDAQGSLDGTALITYQGHEALVRRLSHIHDDSEEIRKSMEEELAELLPMGAQVTMTKIDNIDNNAPALTIQYDVRIPGLAVDAGDRLLLPASPLLGKRQHPFRHADRRYPVYFPYPFREFNDIIITLPEGMTVETRPSSKKVTGEFSSYSLVCVQEEPLKLHIQRDLVIRKSYFALDSYPDLKAFYDAIRTADTDQFILRRASTITDP